MLRRAYYQKSIREFLTDSSESILGTLTKAHHFSLEIQQTNAWVCQISQLKQQLGMLTLSDGDVFFEFAIPRMGKRVDAIVHSANVIFLIEYKVGARTQDRAAMDQVLDYALDLKNFHEHSHDKPIVPIVVATAASPVVNTVVWFDDSVARPLLSNGSDLASLIESVTGDPRSRPHAIQGFGEMPQAPMANWAEGGYHPTPTIVEAAQALYQGHKVEEISRADAGTKNLTLTASALQAVVQEARANSRKAICFVTGVPGAGKTLAGLNISTRNDSDSEEHAVFLSGNGPLVTVLREALARDDVARASMRGDRMDKKSAFEKVSSFGRGTAKRQATR
ncbi:MAG: DUF2075 domain-containing protein [Rhizobiales bacterium]|nr:DUF2075 domain-containing protein [Hyphomicrobiales bacterium]